MARDTVATAQTRDSHGRGSCLGLRPPITGSALNRPGVRDCHPEDDQEEQGQPDVPEDQPCDGQPPAPWPVWRIWERAMWPKMTARIDPTQYSQRMPRTSAAIASPLVPG